MNPRAFCRERDYERALLISYSFDPIFFESVVLPDLWAGRSSDILVCADRIQVDAVMSSVASQIRYLGKRYLMTTAGYSGAFHPKLYIRLGRDSGVVMIGSGNLTSSGWGGNDELATTWRVGPGFDDDGRWLIPLLRDATQWCEGSVQLECLARMQQTRWLTGEGSEAAAVSPLMYSKADAPLSSQLAQRWSGRRFDEVRVMTGSTDESGAFLRWAHRTFGVQRAVVAVTPSNASFAREKLADLPIELRIIPMTSGKCLHAKAYWFDGPSGPAAIMGSANCSAAAWLLPPNEGGNIETVLAYDAPTPLQFSSMLEVFNRHSEPVASVEFSKVAVQVSELAQAKYRLLELYWEATASTIRASLSPAPPPNASVHLLIGEGELAMHLSGAFNEEIWVCEAPELIDFSGSVFARVRVRFENNEWLTQLRWLDHVSELRYFSQSARLTNPIKALELEATPNEQRKLLSELNEVARALFADHDSYSDVGYQRVSRAKPEEPDPNPVDPRALILELHDPTTDLNGGLSRSSGHQLSVGGILALLFDEEEEPSDSQADEDAPDHRPRSADRRSMGGVEGSVSEAVDPRFRQRLAQQIEEFLEKLDTEEFANQCTAAQLLQAVCFPLAVANRGAARGWVEGQQAEQWTQSVFALLFRASPTREHGLLRMVEERYKTNGLEGVFASVIGDGTLWLVLVSMLMATDWQGVGADFEKALAIREVFFAPQLHSVAEADRVSERLDKLRVKGAKQLFVIASPKAIKSLEALEDRLHPIWDELTKLQAGRSISHRRGDLLWRVSSGWVVCAADTDTKSGQENVVVRLRGEERKVRSAFYLNVSEVGRADGTLAALVADVRSAVRTA